MSFSKEIMFKVLAIVLCNNMVLRLAILLFLLLRIFKKKERVNKSFWDWLIGGLVVVLNGLFCFDFMIINFAILGLLSGVSKNVKYESFITFYLFCLIIKGVFEFCLML